MSKKLFSYSFFFSSRRRHTRYIGDWSSDVCSSDLVVLKQSATDLLVKSIHRVHAGEIWLDNRMTAEVMKAFSKSSEAGPRREKPLLSDREKEIVQLVAQGFRNKEIGEKLFISEQTVKNHLHNIFDKLGVSDRLELALYAIHHRLIDQS